MTRKNKFSPKNITIIACLFFIMLALLANGILSLKKSSEKGIAQTLSYQAPEKKYLLKLHDGYLAVYNEGEEIPLQITGISEHSLCNFDHEQLSLGVIVVGDMELAMRLEDYGS